MSLFSITTSDVGHRVVVRARLGDGRASDVLGELVALDPEHVTLRPHDRPEIVVPRLDIVAAKRVPEREVRPSSSIEDVARVIELGWPGLERRRLGGWILRAANGFTGRANSTLPLGDAGLALGDAVDQVEAFYTARSLPPRFSLPCSLDTSTRDHPAPDVDAELDERGYSRQDPTLVLVATMERSATPRAFGGDDVLAWSQEPEADWLSLYRYRGRDLPPVASRVLMSAPVQQFATVRRDGVPVACGRVAVGAGWAGITAMQVADDVRRQHLGSTLLAHLLARGAHLGARFAYLQVAAENNAATGLYRGAGFAAHHGYHYRIAPEKG